MPVSMQIISIDDEPLGVVKDERAELRTDLSPARAAEAQAMALYAMEVQRGAIKGPYNEKVAREFAAKCRP